MNHSQLKQRYHQDISPRNAVYMSQVYLSLATKSLRCMNCRIPARLCHLKAIIARHLKYVLFSNQALA